MGGRTCACRTNGLSVLFTIDYWVVGSVHAEIMDYGLMYAGLMRYRTCARRTNGLSHLCTPD